jgi:lysophospholipid acyltransferase (LPLAT)-like uncharacterized protein
VSFAPVAAAVLWRYLRLIGPSLRCSFRINESVGEDPWRLFKDLVLQDSQAPHFIALWTTDHLNLLSLAFAYGEFPNVARELSFLVDDSFGGRIVGKVLERQSLRSIRIRHGDPAGRLRDLRHLVGSRSPLVLVVDGHGPYFRVGTGISSLVRAVRGVVWPCAARTRLPILMPNARVRVELPRPFSRVRVILGKPVAAGTGALATELSSELQRVLLDLRRSPV